MSDQLSETMPRAALVAVDDEAFGEVISLLQGSSRKDRQVAAAVLSELSKEHPEKLSAIIPSLVAALDSPEAQTRWCILEALTALAAIDATSCEVAIDGAEVALFDERHGYVREKALCFLCKLGAATPTLSCAVWPSLDEAIQCYHGNPEFSGMLEGITEFAQGDLDPSVKTELFKRFEFDANNGKGAFEKRAQHIRSLLK